MTCLSCELGWWRHIYVLRSKLVALVVWSLRPRWCHEQQWALFTFDAHGSENGRSAWLASAILLDGPPNPLKDSHESQWIIQNNDLENLRILKPPTPPWVSAILAPVLLNTILSMAKSSNSFLFCIFLFCIFRWCLLLVLGRGRGDLPGPSPILMCQGFEPRPTLPVIALLNPTSSEERNYLAKLPK